MADQAAIENLQQSTQSPLPNTDPQSKMTTLTPYNVQTQQASPAMYMPVDMNALMGASDPESEKLSQQAVQKYSDALDNAGKDAKASRRGELAERIAGHIAAIGLGAAGKGGGGAAGLNVLEQVHQDSQNARQRQQGLEQQRLGALKNLIDIHNAGHLKAFLEAEKDQRAAQKRIDDHTKEAGRNSRANARMNFNTDLQNQKLLLGRAHLRVAEGNLTERKINDMTNAALRAEQLNDVADYHSSMNKFKDDYLGLAYAQYKRALVNDGAEAAERLLKNDEGMAEAADRHSLALREYNQKVTNKANERDPITHQLINPDAKDPTKPADFSGYLVPEPSSSDLLDKWKTSFRGRAQEEALEALASQQAQAAPMPNAAIKAGGARLDPGAMRISLGSLTPEQLQTMGTTGLGAPETHGVPGKIVSPPTPQNGAAGKVQQLPGTPAGVPKAAAPNPTASRERPKPAAKPHAKIDAKTRSAANKYYDNLTKQSHFDEPTAIAEVIKRYPQMKEALSMQAGR